jgi:hypothetical protein
VNGKGDASPFSSSSELLCVLSMTHSQPRGNGVWERSATLHLCRPLCIRAARHQGLTAGTEPQLRCGLWTVSPTRGLADVIDMAGVFHLGLASRSGQCVW